MAQDRLSSISLHFHPDGHIPLLRELHRVAYEIGQHLAQPSRVAHQHPRYLGRDAAGELQSLFLGVRGHHLGCLLHGGPQVEPLLLQAQLPCLDLGELQDVADDSQERVG